jgi:RNA polymerase sigma-70 factor (ECF subfamily)
MLTTTDKGEHEMKSLNQYHGLFPEAVEAIRYWARCLVQHPVFSSSDLEDVEQDLVMDLYERIPKFDPQQSGFSTFISMVVSRCASRLLSRATTAKRGAMQTVSLDTTVIRNRRGDLFMLSESLHASQCLWGHPGLSWDEVIHLQADLSRMLATAHIRLFDLAMGLFMENAAGVARLFSQSDATICAAIKKIRRILTHRGFRRAYLAGSR